MLEFLIVAFAINGGCALLVFTGIALFYRRKLSFILLVKIAPALAVTGISYYYLGKLGLDNVLLVIAVVIIGGGITLASISLYHSALSGQ
jgi:hypothetical protein